MEDNIVEDWRTSLPDDYREFLAAFNTIKNKTSFSAQEVLAAASFLELASKGSKSKRMLDKLKDACDLLLVTHRFLGIRAVANELRPLKVPESPVPFDVAMQPDYLDVGPKGLIAAINRTFSREDAARIMRRKHLMRCELELIKERTKEGNELKAAKARSRKASAT